MNLEMIIIQLAREYVGVNKTTINDLSLLTKNARQLTDEWQDIVIQECACPISRDYPIGEGTSEQLATFCLFDPSAQTAYEIRVSDKNMDVAFYKSICKVQVYNHMHTIGVKKLIFIVSAKAYKKLSKGLPHKLIESLKSQFDIQIESF